MSKKNADREKEEKKDLEEEDEDEDLDEEDEDEEEDEEPAAATPAADAHRAKGRTRRADDDHDGHDHDHGDEESDEDDPYWWTPHAVMSTLVLIGVLGFLGVFNPILGRFGARPAGASSHDTPAAAHATTAAAVARPPAEQREEYGAKHLLVMYKGSMRAPANITRTEDEAKTRALEAMKKARGGANFADVVKEYSDEPGAAQRGGDLGKFRKGQMVPEFQAAVEKLKVGEISELVKTPFGFHVIQRTQ